MAKVIERTVDINADAPAVWAVLRDLQGFESWNPFMTKASGDLKVGNRPTITMTLPAAKPMTFSPTVLEVENNRKVRWLGKVGPGGIFNGEHTLSIEPREGGGVRFVNHERFSGILVPFMGKTLRKAETAFEKMNAALKMKVEGNAKE
jgi:hypothetical protein